MKNFILKYLKIAPFSFLAHCLTVGNLLSGGVLALELQNRFKVNMPGSLYSTLYSRSTGIERPANV
jgi:hypothetical protein